MFLDFFAPLSRLIKLILMVYWYQYCLAHSNWWFFTSGKSVFIEFSALRGYPYSLVWRHIWMLMSWQRA